MRYPIPEMPKQSEVDFGVVPYEPANAVMGACGILDVVKTEWAEAWSEHDQKVRAGLSRILSRELLSESHFSYDEINGICCDFGAPEYRKTDDGEAWYWCFNGRELPVADTLAELFGAARLALQQTRESK